MGVINLEIACPKTAHGITVDPKPDWSFDDLLSELNSLEGNHKRRSLVPQSLPKANNLRENSPIKRRGGNSTGKSFVMRVTEDVLDYCNYDQAEQNESPSDRLVPASRFHCNDIYFSDSDDSEEFSHDAKGPVIEKVGVVEVALLELTHQHQLCVQDEIRNKISALGAEFLSKSDKLASALAQVEKNAEVRRETDKKLDMQYQRRIAEALDNHLTAVQREHEHKSQIEEKRIKDDAAAEEARRRERAQQEEKWRQQKAKEEEEARIETAKREDELRKAALEAKRKAVNEVAEKTAEENAARNSTSEVATMGVRIGSDMSGSGPKKGSIVRAAENALNLEQRRLKMHEEFNDRNKALITSSNKDFSSYERQVALRIKQISGSMDNARAKASELVRIFDDPACPPSVSMMTFGKKIVSRFENPDAELNASTFACGYVVVLVSAQFPVIMDLIVAELQKACIYTVPKHIMYSKSTFETIEAYLKVIGYREDGKIEARDDYLKRLRCYMKFYGALVQTQITGVQNVHGLQEGWAWLARFVNTLPANIYTAVALEAFLGMAGFALHRKYKSQFRKLLTTISQHYLNALKARGEPELNSMITSLQQYVEDKQFLVEPEGWRLASSLSSRISNFDHDQGHQEQSYYR